MIEHEGLGTLAAAVMLIRRRIRRESEQMERESMALRERGAETSELSRQLDELLMAGDQAGVIALALKS